MINNGKTVVPVNKPGWVAAKGQAMITASKAIPSTNKAMLAPMDKPAGTNDIMQGMDAKLDTMMAMMEKMMAG
jgi:hypothetical protein